MMSHRGVRGAVEGMASLVLGVSGINLVGHLRGAGGAALAWRSGGPGMALSTSLCFFLVASCLLLMSIRLTKHEIAKEVPHE